MIAALIRWSVANRFLVLLATLFLTAAGIWGVPAGFLTIIVVSLITPRPPERMVTMVESLRYPSPVGDRDESIR